jgi:hypothetical protein
LDVSNRCPLFFIFIRRVTNHYWSGQRKQLIAKKGLGNLGGTPGFSKCNLDVGIQRWKRFFFSYSGLEWKTKEKQIRNLWRTQFADDQNDSASYFTSCLNVTSYKQQERSLSTMIWFGWKSLDVEFVGRGIQTNCFCTNGLRAEVIRLYFGKNR